MARVAVRQPQHGVTVLGWPVTVNWLWLVVTACIVGITLESIAPDREGGALLGWYAMALLVLAGIIASLGLHSAAHYLVARRLGQPLRTLEPALLGNLSDAAFPPSSPRTEALVALAGPVVSTVCAVACAGISLAMPSSFEQIRFGFEVLALANLSILVISLIPGFPYDGGRAVRAFVWYLSDDLITGTKMAAFYGQFLAVFAFVLATVCLAAGEPYSVWGAWGLLFLWAINRASREGVERTIWAETSRATTVGDLVMGAATRIDADTSIDAAIDEVLSAVHHGPILVTDGGDITGVFSLASLRHVPRSIWTERQVRDVAVPIDGVPRIAADAPVNQLLDLLDQPGAHLVLVAAPEAGRLLGALDREVTEHRLRERISAERRPRRRES